MAKPITRIATSGKDGEAVIRRYTSIAAVIDVLTRRKLPLLNPETWDDRNDRYFMTLFKERMGYGGIYGLCAAQCAETYHHWRVFTAGGDGACIEIRLAPLEAQLATLDNVRYGSVEYLTLGKVDRIGPAQLEMMPFLKRYGFTDEDEYRVIAWMPADEEQQAALPIDLPHAMIGRLELNPWLPASIAESVIGALKALAPDVQVRRSHLVDSSRWKKAGDRVVGKVPTRSVRLRRRTQTKG